MSGQVNPSDITPCPYCTAGPGDPCVTRNGSVRNQKHAARWDATRRRLRSSLRRCRIRKDDETLGLTAGDVYVCQSYWLDPEKVTALYRETDGFDPECNLYHSDYDFLGFVEATS